MLCFLVINKIEQLQYCNRNYKTYCPSRLGKWMAHGYQSLSSISKCMVLKEKKAHPFFINLTDICLNLLCLLITTKNVYN